MPDRPKWFQTTAIDYPNSRPHIGTAFEKVGADVQARYRRMEGYDVFFLMGNDENTLKVADRAKELGLEPQAYCDDMARQFREVWDALDVSYDIFVQTSSERHKACARKFAQQVYDNGHIYKGEFEGWYCPGCEEFKSEKIHAEHGGQCPNHKRPLVRRKEPCYFFKLSAFSDRLLKHLKENPEFVQPESRRNEMIGFIEAEGLKDLNISRHGEQWGIRLPFDPEFTIYVWFDALLTYITGIGYADDPALFARLWPCDVHFIGKDITRFHAIYWPAFLMSAGIPMPKQIVVHGFLFSRGEKMSKSVGNVVSPTDLVRSYGVDQTRYFFLREVPFGQDGNYSHEAIVSRINADLANDLGNLAQRSLSMIAKNCGGKVPVCGPLSAADSEILAAADAICAEARAAHANFALNKALDAIWKVVAEANRYFAGQEPWALKKSDPARMDTVLYVTAEVLRIVGIMAQPYVPDSAARLLDLLGVPAGQRSFTDLGTRLTSGATLPAPTPIFPRYVEEGDAAPARA